MTFHHLVEAFEKAPSCGLCALEAKSMRRYFDSVLYESVTDPAVREELRRAHGYCSTHALYLINLRSAFDTAVMYQDEIGDLLRLVERLPDEPPSRKKRKKSEEISAEWVEHERCPACRIQRDTRRHYLEALAKSFDEEALRKAYESGSGLCLPHLRLFLRESLTTETRRLVLERERATLDGLGAELRELVRKFDYRFSDEKVGEERDSWRRAVLLVNGSPLSFPEGLNGSFFGR